MKRNSYKTTANSLGKMNSEKLLHAKMCPSHEGITILFL